MECARNGAKDRHGGERHVGESRHGNLVGQGNKTTSSEEMKSCYSWKTCCSKRSLLNGGTLGSFEVFRACRIGWPRQKIKISAAVESVIVEDKKIVKLEFQITNARYRRGFDVKTANDQEHTQKKLLQELERLECGSRQQIWSRRKKRRMSEELEVEVTIDQEKERFMSIVNLARSDQQI